MSKELASIDGARGDVLHVTQLGISQKLDVGLQFLTGGKHGLEGHATLHREGVAELLRVLSTWLALGPSPIPPPERGDVVYSDGWVEWYWTKDRALIVMNWRAGGLWVSYPPGQVYDFTNRLRESVEPRRL